MTNNEDYIKKMVGKENPFRVPEGYFDQLAQQVMQALPDESKEETHQAELPQRRRKLIVLPGSKAQRWLAAGICAAACLCGVISTTALYFSASQAEPDAQAVKTVAVSSDVRTYEDEVVDYAMMDNGDIYAYLSSAE